MAARSRQAALAALGGGGASWVNETALEFADAAAFATNYDILNDGPGGIGQGTHTVAARADLLADVVVAYASGTPTKALINSGVGLEVDTATGASELWLSWLAADLIPSYDEYDLVRFLVELSAFPVTAGRPFFWYENAGGTRYHSVEQTGSTLIYQSVRYNGAWNTFQDTPAKMNTLAIEKWGEHMHGSRTTSGIDPALDPGAGSSWNKHPGSGSGDFVAATDRIKLSIKNVDGTVVKRVLAQRYK